MLVEMKRRKYFWKTFNSGDFTEKKILPDTKKGCMTVRQVSIGNSLAIWDST